MLTVTLPDTVEAALLDAAQRSGQSVSEYLTVMCADMLSLEVDRARLDSYLAGAPAISHERARAWLADLAAGNRTECPK
jgi:hypothetical protein